MLENRICKTPPLEKLFDRHIEKNVIGKALKIFDFSRMTPIETANKEISFDICKVRSNYSSVIINGRQYEVSDSKIISHNGAIIGEIDSRFIHRIRPLGFIDSLDGKVYRNGCKKPIGYYKKNVTKKEIYDGNNFIIIPCKPVNAIYLSIIFQHMHQLTYMLKKMG